MEYAIERVLKQERIDAKEKTAIEIAKRMLKKGFSLEDIADITKLSIATIHDLAKGLGH